jgi:hypothetical protein
MEKKICCSWIHSIRGRQGVIDTLNCNGFKIRIEILKPLVEQIYAIEGNGEEKIIATKLPIVGTKFCSNKLVFLNNGIGVVREPKRPGDQERVARLNVYVQQQLGKIWFKWCCPRITDVHELARKHRLPLPVGFRRTVGGKALPTCSIPRLFEASYVLFCLEKNDSDLVLPKTGFVHNEIKLALKRQHAGGLEDRRAYLFARHYPLVDLPLTKRRRYKKKERVNPIPESLRFDVQLSHHEAKHEKKEDKEETNPHEIEFSQAFRQEFSQDYRSTNCEESDNMKPLLESNLQYVPLANDPFLPFEWD